MTGDVQSINVSVTDFEARGNRWTAMAIPQGDSAKVWIAATDEGAARYAFTIPAAAAESSLDPAFVMSKGGTLEAMEILAADLGLVLEDEEWEGVNQGDDFTEWRIGTDKGPFSIRVTLEK